MVGFWRNRRFPQLQSCPFLLILPIMRAYRERVAHPYRDLDVIDSRAPRFNQATVGVVALLAVASGWWWLLALLAAQLAVGLTFGRQYCLPCLFYFEVVQRVFGEVYLWGQVIRGARGWRTEYAYPRRVYVPTTRYARGPIVPPDEIAFHLADYGVPVEIVEVGGNLLCA